MNWEVVIGLETHVQLKTRSKIFSGSSIAFGAEPNVQASAVDIALPGVLPVLNREAVVCAIKFGLAVEAQIAPRSIFARKNYFYPDLPKGYQISQFEIPVVLGGGLNIRVGAANNPNETATEKFVRLTRAHLEEDAGKSLHEDFHGRTGIDLNRAGTPLLEIVTEPDMRSSAEAVAYARALHALVQWIGICDGNMQEGSFRCDANVSVRPQGQKEFGTRREIKNLNSFRFMQQAIDFEAQWQINEIEEGRAIRQATVLFDPDTGETRAMRSKEDAHDYRYFPDPDLLPLEITADWIAQVRSEMPELPQAMKRRFETGYGLSAYDAGMLTATRATSGFFEDAVAAAGKDRAKLCANWITGELAAHLNKADLSIEASPVSAAQLAGIVRRIADNTISNKIARDVFEALWAGDGKDADAVIEARGLKQITDTGAIEALVDEVLAANQKSVEEFRAGKEKAFNALVGQAMKATRGKANPQQVTDLLTSRYDRRHDLSVVGSYELNDRWKISSVFIYGTGNAVTMPERFYFVGGVLTQEYSRINAYRLKPYHRLDFSATYTPKHNAKRKYKDNWIFSIYNVYSRLNPYFVYFDQTGSLANGDLKVVPLQVSLFPIIPSVTWNLKF